MPIYEFKCLKCNDCFEILIMGRDETVETKCPNCGSEDFERILSAANHAVRGTSGPGSSAMSTSRSCSSGSCTTYDIPGPD
ncbi:MAG: zinc ribbon domain-containing protein [Proteobacteria bacterium]|nr:zinc ribbon domain-containing protein [Desulfobacteraceae bacterium]MBU4001493.1 zinc ribbon domain-containing protein [Pseudomonadota bacterium]MBU4053724.1 zinc ribbon domain-containing protein [Pseudomonadota bacterium]MBU4318932.1 zinc ribbon domain-containing protein [Pseudomonadota bacterium]MBU4469612.1 zinc ribbon domain-containing protein [Pseudomonadota bacterium]